MTFIIAEIGVNHNNNLGFSKKLIDFCSSQKVDAVKFQTFKAENLAQKYTPKVLYQKKNKNDKHSTRGLLKAVNQRKRLLVYLKRKNPDSYTNILSKLKLRK